MASIIISFVGNQDPYSGTTDRPGSIVSLVEHLLTQQQSIKHICLLYTAGTELGAKDTKEWLNLDLGIPVDAIEIHPVDEALSHDPIDVVLATRAAKQEFDLNIIEQQLAEYNYSGVLATARSSDLASPEIEALLKYGHSRRSFDFDRANNVVENFKHYLPAKLATEIAQLRQKDKLALLKEVYFIAEISLKNHDYCNFLIAISQFQENFLKLCLENIGLAIPNEPKQMSEFWDNLKNVEGGKIYRELETAKNIDRHKKYLVTGGNVNIPTQIEILELMESDSKLLAKIKDLKDYCEARNLYIHRLEGISHIDDAESVLRNIKSILKQYTKMPDLLPFDLLNTSILKLLSTKIHSL